MELLHELLLSAFIAALFSFIIAKLVSDASNSTQKDTKFSEGGVTVEERGLKVEGFKGVRRVEAADDAVVQKVNKFDGENPVPFVGAVVPEVSRSGVPGNSEEQSSGEETKGFDNGDKDACCVEVKREGVIDDEVKDGEFSAEGGELKRDVVEDEVKDGELNAQNEGMKDGGDSEAKGGEVSCGEINEKYECGELKRHVIEDEVKDGELNSQNEVMNDGGDSEAKNDEVRGGEINENYECGELNRDVIEVKYGGFSAESDELKRDVIEDEVKDAELYAQNELMKHGGDSEAKDDKVRGGDIKENYEVFGDEEGVSKEVLWSDDLDDSWEGIEITEMEKIFAEATKFVASKENFERVSSFGSDVLLELDALHKVVAEGPCLEPQPMALKVSARAKWNARQRLGNMNPDTALEQYVALLSEKIPGWMDETSENIQSGLVTDAITGSSDSSLSTDPHHQPHPTVERPLSGVKEGDLVEATDLDNKEMK